MGDRSRRRWRRGEGDGDMERRRGEGEAETRERPGRRTTADARRLPVRDMATDGSPIRSGLGIRFGEKRLPICVGTTACEADPDRLVESRCRFGWIGHRARLWALFGLVVPRALMID
ncbi:hypothetical protein ZWY2020_038503 [Hordeum vulgare]|nr:hypothetical protein ZWY2020_038503 [Hordeum vulgare]